MQHHVTRNALTAGILYLLAGCSGLPSTPASNDRKYEVAYLSDVHFHDVYARFEDGSFKGLPSANGKNATIRSMQAQLNSTRLFNENYFAFLAALDRVVERGVKTVVISGDFSDDGQPLHMRGLQEVMDRYTRQHGLRFFVTLGNHDPERPLAIASGKPDYLGTGGKAQPIFSKGGAPECAGYDTPWAERKGTICTQEVVHGGYAEVFRFMGNYGLQPQSGDVYWETPYSSYKGQATYSFARASEEASLGHRRFEICKQGTGGRYKKPEYTDCMMSPDASYLVEPTPGLWLLSVDANVYLPNKPSASDPRDQTTGSGDNGYNRMVTHKQQVIVWIKDVAERARREGKTLSVFSHFPMTPFYRESTPDITTVFGTGGLDLKREPTPATTAALAATGIGVHFAGHIHANDTAIHKKDGNFLVNIQVPSLAAYVPAFKHVTHRADGKVDVRTVGIDTVPRFNELFEHYRTEHRFMSENNLPGRWDAGILASRNYAEFASWHIAELTRLRFLERNWPCEMRTSLLSLNGADMLTLALLETAVTEAQLQQAGKDTANLRACTALEKALEAPIEPVALYDADWQAAQARAAMLAKANGLSLDQLAAIRGIDLAIDFHRALNAGELAFADVKPKAAFYKTLNEALKNRTGTIRMSTQDPKKPSSENASGRIFQVRFKPLLEAMVKASSAPPNREFTIDLRHQTVNSAGADELGIR